MKPAIGHLQVITDETIQQRFSHVDLARLAIAGGADTIQLRDKQQGTGSLTRTAAGVHEVCRSAGVPLIINDRPDVAMAIDADGVHLGRTDFPIGEARRLLGPKKTIGTTASSIEEARRCQEDGADYIGFGHIFSTTSKQKKERPLGPHILCDLQESMSIPVIAIGGIDETNIELVLTMRVWGVAVLGAVCAKEDPAAATRHLINIAERAVAARQRQT